MISLRKATIPFQQPGHSLSVQQVVDGLPFLPARPISITRLALLLNRGGAVARLGGRYAKVVNALDLASDGLLGFMDLHTHPAAHLGFGTELFYGPPDGDPAQVFNNCNGFMAALV
jgi:hypothetical protein